MRRSIVTYILLLLAVVVIGVYYYLNNREEPEAGIALTLEPESEVSYLFTPEDGTPTSIHIDSKAGEAVEVKRNADNAWALILPTEAPADQDLVDAAVSQVPVIEIVDHAPGLSPKDVGLDVPEYTIKLKFTSGVERKVNIGVVTPSENGYYASLDGGEILIVSKYSMDSLLDFLTNPPYLPTETPPLSTPEAVSP